MFKEAYHPKAYLSSRRNVRLGVATRTKIILRLEARESSVQDIAQSTELSSKTVRHHLHLLEAERILLRTAKKPYVWGLTGAGQQRIT